MAGFGHPPPFTNDEKNFILAEVIKTNVPHHSVLLGLVNQNNYQPKWDEMPLPSGRSVNACKYAFEEMRRGMYSPLSQAGGGPMSAAAMPKRQLPSEHTYPGGRAILPKTSTYYPPALAEPPAKRKRGRPTKAEQQARAAESAGEASSSAGIMGARVQTPQSASMPTSPAVFARASSQTLPAVSRMSVSAVITPTAPAKSASHSSSSSGKRRRRGRSDERSVQEESGGSYISQYGRPSTEETPARAAARRRDEPIHSTVARLGVSEVEQVPGAPSSASPGSFGGPS